MVRIIAVTLLVAFTYPVESAERLSLHPLPQASMHKPKVPDISTYTREAVWEKIQLPKTQAVVSVKRLEESREYLRSVYSSNFLAFAKMQNQLPQAIFIEQGTINLSSLSKHVSNSLKQSAPDTFLAQLPIIVNAGAALVIDDGNTLRLSAERGAFIHSNGLLIVDSARVEGWLESAKKQSDYTGDEAKFRPFIRSYGGSQTYFIGAAFYALGYDAVDAYGVSFKRTSEQLLSTVNAQERVRLSTPPTGVILDSEFYDLYFGFYCYGAKDVVLVGNRYINNIIYGIDPHDYSSNLLIANNTVIGTQRHGIIVSRHVNDSYIVNNISKGNARTGIMVERNSRNNVVAFNETTENQGDGITIYESPDNLIYGNRVYDNKEHGIRVRNSVNVRLYHNIVLNNKGAGVYFHISDLSYQTDRDLTLDPYKMESSGEVVGGLIAFNESGAVFSEGTRSILLGNIRLQSNGTTPLRGELESHSAAIKVAAWDKAVAVKIVSVESQVSNYAHP